MSRSFTIEPDRLRFAVRVTARSRRNEITGMTTRPDGRAMLSVRLAAPPVDGAANEALRRLIAGALGVPLGDVAIASGRASRVKTVELAGDGPALAARLERLLA